MSNIPGYLHRINQAGFVGGGAGPPGSNRTFVGMSGGGAGIYQFEAHWWRPSSGQLIGQPKCLRGGQRAAGAHRRHGSCGRARRSGPGTPALPQPRRAASATAPAVKYDGDVANPSRIRTVECMSQGYKQGAAIASESIGWALDRQLLGIKSRCPVRGCRSSCTRCGSGPACSNARPACSSR